MRTKSEIRKEILKKIKNQKSKIKDEKDRIIKEKVLSLEEFKRAKVVAFYVSLESEVDTTALIDEALKMGKRVVIPAIAGDVLYLAMIKDRKSASLKGPYGILQPAVGSFNPFPKEDVDLIIVPAVAFDKKMQRLGRGKGFYDRFLKDLPKNIKKIGLAYDLQIMEDLPVTPRDIPVDMVITN